MYREESQAADPITHIFEADKVDISDPHYPR